MKRHKRAALSIEHSAKVRDVLRACGFDSETLGDWNIEQLDTLPNFRKYQLTPRRHHTQWKVVGGDQRSTLPSLEEILVDVTCRVRNRAHRRSVYNGTEVWLHNKHIQLTPQEFSAWSKQILEGEQSETRVVNMPMDFVRVEAKRSCCDVNELF
jgi:hypothetical protein